MPKRRARRLAKPRDGDKIDVAGSVNNVGGYQLNVEGDGRGLGAADRTKLGGASALAFPDDESIDYSEIPDVGDDEAYWKGGRVGPVVPAKSPAHPG